MKSSLIIAAELKKEAHMTAVEKIYHPLKTDVLIVNDAVVISSQTAFDSSVVIIDDPENVTKVYVANGALSINRRSKKPITILVDVENYNEDKIWEFQKLISHFISICTMSKSNGLITLYQDNNSSIKYTNKYTDDSFLIALQCIGREMHVFKSELPALNIRRTTQRDSGNKQHVSSVVITVNEAHAANYKGISFIDPHPLLLNAISTIGTWSNKNSHTDILHDEKMPIKLAGDISIPIINQDDLDRLLGFTDGTIDSVRDDDTLVEAWKALAGDDDIDHNNMLINDLPAADLQSR